MTDDLVKRLRSIHTAADCDKAADRIDTLTAQLESTLKDRAEIMAERDQWIQHAKNAVWADSEEVKLLTEDNVRLREALETIGKTGPKDGLLIHSGRQIVAIINDALNTGKDDT